MPCYAKSHSQGEYVFDWGWAEAFERAGGDYYPKLQVSVPFTPVTGPRLLVPPGPDAAKRKQMLAAGLVELCRRSGASSAHLTFLPEEDADLAGRAWDSSAAPTSNSTGPTQDYGDFDGFLEALASRKRKAIRKERREALEGGISIRMADRKRPHRGALGQLSSPSTWTPARANGAGPISTAASSRCSASGWPTRVLLVMAKRDGRYIAGALNLIGSDTLYGRYWGAIEEHPYLHFEVCYYQAIDFALAHGLTRVEAGAQGAHKLARGYMPHDHAFRPLHRRSEFPPRRRGVSPRGAARGRVPGRVACRARALPQT